MCRLRISPAWVFAAWLCVFLRPCPVLAAAESQPTPEKPAKTEKVEKPAEPKYPPGRTSTITDPTCGKYGRYCVYVPAEYTRDVAWPVILCYHGLKANPTTYPFNRVPGGKRFIIVGMWYHKEDLEGYAYVRSHDVPILRRMLAELDRHLNIDKRKIFAGGFSRGGFHSSCVINAVPELLAGAIILGAGLQDSAINPAALRGKPIFVGCGTEDTPHLKHAREANTYYRSLGANLTYEEWQGVEHKMPPSQQTKLGDWLMRMGPLSDVDAKLAKARSLQTAGKPGAAYALCSQLASLSDTDPSCQAAAKIVKDLADKAEAQLADGNKAADEKRYPEAIKALAALTTAYAGSKFAAQAQERLDKLKADPEIAAAIQQAEVDAKASDLEARAAAAERAKEYADAIKSYETYVANFPKASRYKQVADHLAALKSDEKIQNEMRSGQADKDCNKWLSMAENYVKAGMQTEARPYLQKVLEKYPQSKYAQRARELMAQIEGGAGDGS